MKDEFRNIVGLLHYLKIVSVPEKRMDAGNHIVYARHYEGARATDGTRIDTRKRHQEYMKERGLTTIDDFQSTFAKATKAREDFYQGKTGREERRQAIARAIQMVKEGRGAKPQQQVGAD